ncbi:MAG: BON domain-containing protein [Acidobacteria bacterium]|nr:BON domain-containing protein [Acidobacteriota bacterium]
MANRYGQDLGRRDRESSRRAGFGQRRFASGSRPFGDDERYFGGSRRYGEGNADRPYGTSAWEGRDYDDEARYSSDNRENESASDRGMYRGDERTRRGGSYTSGYTGGAYSGRGYSDGRSGDYGRVRSQDRWAGHGGADVGLYSYRYERDYPSSEIGYTQDREENDERGWWDKTSDEVSAWFGDEDAARRRRMDAQNGGHRGRGPAGYTRSDDRIKEDINDRLTDYDYIDATEVNVDVSGGDVTLSGTVDSRYEKRLAEDLAEDISGVKNVENRLRVNSASVGANTSSTRSTAAPNAASTQTATGAQAKGKSSSGS